MDVSFGARLRAQREERQLTLAAIAAQTKIKQSLLDGLERDDVSAWPKGIFRRSFVRDYARAIGLDPESIVRQFLEQYPDPVEQTPFGPGGAPLTETDLVQVHAEATRLQRLVSAAKTAMPTLLSRGQAADRATTPDTSAHTPAPREVRPTLALTFDAPPTMPRREMAEAGDGMSVQPDNASAPPAEWVSPRRSEDFATPPTRRASLADPVAESPTEWPRARTATHQELDVCALAHVCTTLARLVEWEAVMPLLAEAARILYATGVTVWYWEPRIAQLMPIASHGYTDALVASLPAIHPEDDNVIADAFRSGGTRIVAGGAGMTGAVAVPVLASAGCVGVLAVEMRDGREQEPALAAAAAIIAAQLAALFTSPQEIRAASA